MFKSFRNMSTANRQRLMETAEKVDALMDELRRERLFRETTKIERIRLMEEYNDELMRQAMLTEELKRQELFVKKNN